MHLWNEFGPLILLLVGGIVGLVLTSRRPYWRRPRRAPFADIAKAARPLALPLLVVLALGTIRFSAVVQVLAVALIVLLGWRFFFKPAAIEAEAAVEGETGLRAWARDHQKPILIHLAAAIVVVGGVLLLTQIVPSLVSSPYFEASGDITSALLLTAIVLWVLALLLRLASYATSFLRAAFSLVALAALLLLGAAVGVLPFNHNPSETIPLAVSVLGIIAVVLLMLDVVIDAIAPTDEDGYAELEAKPPPEGFAVGLMAPLRRRPVPKRATESATRLGFYTAVLASTVLAVSTAWGLLAAAERAEPLHPPPGTSAEAKPTIAAPGASPDDLTLAQLYAPVLVLSMDEPWSPIGVDSYLENARLTGPERNKKGVAAADLPPGCRGGRSYCYTLSIGCESGDEACAHRSETKRERGQLYREGATYVRVLRKRSADPSKRWERIFFPPRGPFRKDLSYLLQYWYFYYYDEWKAPVFAGLLTQRHEGDWENVTIGLDGERRPLFVADSAHCAGSWRRWRKVEVTTELEGALHPLIAVAEGSHANYPDPDQSRTPDPGHCQGLPDGAATALSYASNIRDRTEYGWLWFPAPDGWHLVDEETPPMQFAGTWGANDRTTLRNFNSHKLGEGVGPQTPSLQASWTAPVDTIFCGRYTPPECETDRTAGR